jgi:hypothetical protein
MRPVLILLFVLVSPVLAQQNTTPNQKESPSVATTNMMDEVYRDESHCLTAPEIRRDEDAPISCYCRDAVADARYVYHTYLLSGKDRNLNGTFFVLTDHISEMCGKDYNALGIAEQEDWHWNGPEVVRTYPPDEVIARISPEMKDGKPIGRWVPFTVQLVYRDGQGHVTRTENYSNREFEPVLPK